VTGTLIRILKALLLLAALSVGLGLGYIWHIGAWRVVFPSSQHDSVAPTLPAELQSPGILLFSKTNGFRHKEGIAGGNRALSAIAAERNWGVFATENGAIFNAGDLQRFAVVVFQNATGDMLSDEQQQAFQRWLEGGGGWLGIHAAGDGSHAGWQWYMDKLLGAEFTAHIMDPQFQRATVVTEAAEHPVTRNLPPVWDHVEEWYSWKASPRTRGFTILATVDESSYTPVQKLMGTERDLRMGDHPVAWSNCVGQGRALYVALGHKAEAFDNPHYRRLLGNALTWLTGSAAGC
jgi:type 1 glutamine amidotransferase